MAKFLWFAACLAALPLQAQLVTGSVTGTVADASGAVIPAARVTLDSVATGSARTVSSESNGAFTFGAVAPGDYSLTVEREGFRKLRRTGVAVSPNQTVSVGEIRLEVGNVAESVSVSAAVETVQTATSERAGIITNEQVENLTTINRDFAALVSLLPGVVETPGAETQGFNSNSSFNVQGARVTANSVAIDGMPVTQPNGTSTGTFLTMDSVAAVRLTVSTYQAEFGRKPGASIQAVTKSGTLQYHGAAYWYKRHEMLNANSFFNNRGGIAEARYRYTTAGANVGGPLLIPGLFDRTRRKAFFFLASEQLREARPQGIRQLTTASEAERGGDFSNSRDTNGAVIVVRDPLTRVAFPGNVVPASRINRNGQNYLKLLPAPNYDNLAVSARRYNYQAQESLFIPKSSEVLRVDLPVNDKTNIYGRFNYWWEKQQGWAVPGGNSNWGWMPSSYENTSKSMVASLSRILTPSLIFEASGSVLHWVELAAPLKQDELTRITRKAAGVEIPQLRPENNPLNFVPNATFGGLSQPISTQLEGRFPLGGTNFITTYNAMATKTSGAHVLKAGVWRERWDVSKVGSGNFNGTLDFGRNVNNPNDSNHPFANALLGNFYSYTESTTRPPFYNVATSVEWFVQDNWKATRRLTLDFGSRFAWSTPFYVPGGVEAGFVPERYDRAKQVSLLRPVLNNGVRSALDPLTGAVSPAIYIGAISKAGGDPYNGTVDRRSEPAYPEGMWNRSGIKTAPRVGFAWDPFGRGKTAVRGGWGLFYEVIERSQTNLSNPPLKVDPIIYNSNIAEFTSQAGVNYPTATSGFNLKRPLGRVMNYSLGVQQAVGFATVVDVSYVAALSRHLLQQRNLNSIPFGANFVNRDPTLPNSPLAASFLRPYVGYNDISYAQYDGNASYHSLQTTVNRRFSRGLQFGGAWTWSKTMDYADNDTTNVTMLLSRRVWNYGKAGFDRTHIVKVNFVWDAPRFSRLWNHAATRQALDGWQVSGIASFVSGAPATVGAGFTYTVDVTGSPTDGARVVVLQNPVIPKSERSFDRNFNTQAFGPPAVGTVGNAAKDLFRGPGINNWDLSLFKNFKLPGERFKLQFRVEGYNAFNHTQYSALDTAARFDQQARQTNTALSQFTAARNSRRVQLALRLAF